MIYGGMARLQDVRSSMSMLRFIQRKGTGMNVFDLDSSVVRDYERFARSFTEIRAEDIREQVDAIYATGRFWPEPLISVNPHYERDASVAW
jgi:hypothetical protein